MISEIPRISEYGEPFGPTKAMKFNNRVDYLSVPLLIKITFKTKHINPYFVTGPRFDFFLAYESKSFGVLYDKFKDMDVGGTVGVGAESNAKPQGALFEFRYSPDFSNAYKTDLLRVKNHSFEILFGFRL